MQRRLLSLFHEGEALLLPQIKLVTDLAQNANLQDIPPATAPLRRRLEIARLVKGLIDADPTLAARSSAFDLAESLVALMGEMQGEGVAPDVISNLDVTDQSGHWQRSLSFIDLVQRYFNTGHQPDVEGRQRLVIESQIEHWNVNPPTNPIIVAGSTGSRGATSLFMQAVANLPQGAIILPGVDRDMPHNVWNRLDQKKRDIKPWGSSVGVNAARTALISLSLRPAPVTDQWIKDGPDLDDLKHATDGLTLIEAPTPRAEADAIAVRLRQAVEDGQTAALITPDRMLTRQVAGALDRWGIIPDDSAGLPLQLTAPGRFLRHIVDLFSAPLDAERLLVLLRHPLTNSTTKTGNKHSLYTNSLELELRRNGPPFPNAQSLTDWANETADRDPERRVWADWVGDVLTGLEDGRLRPLTEHIEHHIDIAERLSAGVDNDGSGELWKEAAGREALRVITELRTHADAGGDMSAWDYRQLIGSVLASGDVRNPDDGHPQVLIWGTLEARVQSADLVILGGMNEGTWPEATAPDPWLNRPLRMQAGLLLPERRIGLSAHDYQQAVCANQVVISRAIRSDEAETVSSRWVNRLTNLLGGLIEKSGPECLNDMRDRGAHWLSLAAQIAAPSAQIPAAPRPSPAPPTTARPDQLSVTQIKTLIRDPYAIYGRNVLRLNALDPLARAADAPLRGIIVHEILETFIKRNIDPTDPAAHDVIMKITDDTLLENCPWPAMRILWRARIASFVPHFLSEEQKRRATSSNVGTEMRGELRLPSIPFTLTGMADRIDLTHDGDALIYDYKTGKPPSADQQRHFDKQLLLEAAMVERGAFKALGKVRTEAAIYIGLGGDLKDVNAPLKDAPPDETLDKFERLITKWMDPAKGYTARRANETLTFTGDYDHLARYGEWDETDDPIIEAADPTRSTWLSANAGSGKTRVLTDRVARLLLDGTKPENVLCLTYTKAAASEMQNRLFKRLGEWAMMPADKLRDQLKKMGAAALVDDAYLANARTLFAAAIETPGGLKIQTIHSFCAGILRRFPLEAEVSPQFKEMEDRAATILREEVLDEMAVGKHTDAVSAFAKYYTGADIAQFLAAITSRRISFIAPKSDEELAKAFGIPKGTTPKDAIDVAFVGGEDGLADDLVDACKGTSKTYENFAADLKKLNLVTPDLTTLDDLFSLFLYAADKTSKSRNWPQARHTKAVEALAHIVDDTHAWMDRTADAYDYLNRINALEKTRALFAFATPFVTEYERKKVERAALDFDDLISKAKALLEDPAVAQWVLFRLDGGVDHVLVDEAQDTSPDQWDIVRLLTQEFSTGIGAHPDRTRTVFVVGDKKQSIYSFQGADPEGFDRMKDHFAGELSKIKKHLQDSELLYSFRSSEAILQLVDRTFQNEMADGIGDRIKHLAFKKEMPGRIDLWPMIEPSNKPEEREWDDPVDLKGRTNNKVMLAHQIASEIKRMIKEETLPVKGENDTTWSRRKITPGDVLILVQRRSDLFDEIIAACKSANLEIAGADRLKLGGELAVKDISALLQFLSLQDDDLSLAAALKSPLFGWDEKKLYDLAQPRPKRQSLWEALRTSGMHDDTLAVLLDLRNNTDFLRPYDLINRLLIRHNGRKNLLARLGHEAEDGIDALLSQALGYEQSDVPSLTGFLSWLQTEDVTVKRQMDSAGDRIRVMTVHGAKGLEAPIVILPDTTKRKREVRGDLLTSDSHVFWKPKSDVMPQSLRDVQNDMLDAQDRERRRLLYVAMTRAENWLIVAAAGEDAKNEGSWHTTISDAMDNLDAVTHNASFGAIKRFSRLDWTAGQLQNSTHPTDVAPPKRQFGDKLPDPKTRQKTLSPSDLGGQKILSGETHTDTSDLALAWGRLVHLLLETLPNVDPTKWKTTAQTLIKNQPDVGLIPDHNTLIDEAIATLTAPNLAWLWTDGLAEVPISATLPSLDDRRIFGIIDRLIITETDVIAVDYKTNRAVPQLPKETPNGLARQMGAYRDALGQIYPNHRIRTLLLWTKTNTTTELSNATLDAALKAVTTP
ncbi:ATP-dependent helicase/nuclease subunit A [Nymphon striatum]|nr:ATP-dependent helicase/nuclease subunit A [Nymphon striatum]